jgi:RNA polymerase sigma factor (sigma-70 family)
MSVGRNNKYQDPRFRILDIYEKNRASLRRFISRFSVSSQDIDDITQETFLRAYQVEKKRKIDEPKALLFRIARNLVLDDLAKKKVRSIVHFLEDAGDWEVALEGDALEDNILAQEKLGIFCEAIATLPPQCRKVVLLKKVYGFSHKEIAKQLGISVSTTEKHLVKAVRQCSNVIYERYQDRVVEASGRSEQADTRFRKSEV